MDNSRREDIALDRTPGRDEGIQLRRLPASERGLTETDGDPKQAVRGNGGRRLHTSYVWLLDYWQARYFGFLAAPDKEK